MKDKCNLNKIYSISGAASTVGQCNKSKLVLLPFLLTADAPRLQLPGKMRIYVTACAACISSDQPFEHQKNVAEHQKNVISSLN